MLIPIVCFTCGLPVGDKADLFRRLKAERVNRILAEHGTVPSQVPFDSKLQIDCEDILDRLKIRRPCCRTRLVTAMEFVDYY